MVYYELIIGDKFHGAIENAASNNFSNLDSSEVVTLIRPARKSTGAFK